MTKQLILAAIVMLVLLCGIAMADTCGDYEYEVLEDGTAQITKYSGSEQDVIIPG